MADFALVQTRKLLSARVFAVQDETWRGPGRKTFHRQTIVHPGAVAIVPFDRAGNILMLRQFRPSVRRTILEIPAGTLEKGERPLACARRELVEETGFAARRWKKLGAVFTAPGFCNERIVLFKAWDLYPAHAEQDEDEHIAVEPMTLKQIHAAVRRGRICDAKSLGALLHLALLD